MKSSPQLHVGGHCCSMRQGEGRGEGYWETGVEMTGQGGTPAKADQKKRDVQCQAATLEASPWEIRKKKKKKKADYEQT